MYIDISLSASILSTMMARVQLFNIIVIPIIFLERKENDISIVLHVVVDDDGNTREKLHKSICSLILMSKADTMLNIIEKRPSRWFTRLLTTS
jgi:hypothetical protein